MDNLKNLQNWTRKEQNKHIGDKLKSFWRNRIHAESIEIFHKCWTFSPEGLIPVRGGKYVYPACLQNRPRQSVLAVSNQETQKLNKLRKYVEDNWHDSGKTMYEVLSGGTIGGKQNTQIRMKAEKSTSVCFCYVNSVWRDGLCVMAP